MRKVLLFLVVSFIIMGTLGAHAIIPDSATVEVPTPESDYIQDTDVQSENFAEPEPVVVETVVDEDSEQVTDELTIVDSEQIEGTAVVETFNDVDVEPEVSTEPEQIVVESAMDEVTEQPADEMSAVDSETSEKMVTEPFNVLDVETETVAMEAAVDEAIEQAADELSVADSEAFEETVVESINDVDVEPEVYAEPESVVVEPHVDEVAEQPADELSAADPEQADSLLVETEDVAEDEESKQTPYAEDMEDVEEAVAETEVPEPVDADVESIGDDTDDMENVQMVTDIVPNEGNDNDMESVDVQPEEVEPLVESDEETGISGKVLLSMEATHFAWNFSSNGGSSGLALPCSGVSAEWLFSNRFAYGINVRVSTESDGTSYRTNLGILNRFGMLSDMKNILNEANVVFFKGDVLLGLTIKDAVGGIATLPTIGLGGSVHFGRDFLTMAFGVDGIVMFPLSGTDRTPVYSIRPNMALTWIL